MAYANRTLPFKFTVSFASGAAYASQPPVADILVSVLNAQTGGAIVEGSFPPANPLVGTLDKNNFPAGTYPVRVRQRAADGTILDEKTVTMAIPDDVPFLAINNVVAA